MGTFGERLQREREMRGITLEEIAEATKIGTRSLRALEEQDFDKLPGGIFNKGFVRAYSKYLGIDEDQAVADYVTAVNEAQSAGKLSRPEYAPPAIEDDTDKPEPVRIPWGLLIVIALIAVIGLSARSYYSQSGWSKLKRQATPAQAKTVQAQVPAAPQATPPTDPVAQPVVDSAQKQDTTPAIAANGVKTPGQANSAPDRGTPAEEFVVKVRAKEASWVWIKADGKIVLNQTLAASTEQVVRASKQAIVVVGNAGGVEISRNDKLLPPIGQGGEKKTVVLTAQGEQIQQ